MFQHLPSWQCMSIRIICHMCSSYPGQLLEYRIPNNYQGLSTTGRKKRTYERSSTLNLSVKILTHTGLEYGKYMECYDVNV